MLNNKMVCIVGSTQFSKYMEEISAKLSGLGYIVLLPVLYLDKKDMPLETLSKLMTLHRKKMDIADYIFVVDVFGYQGTGTIEEIDYAKSIEKTIYFYNNNDLEKLI